MKHSDLNEKIPPSLIQGTKFLKSDSDTRSLIAARALIRASAGEVLTGPERNALKEYVELFSKLIMNPSLRVRMKEMQKMIDPKDHSAIQDYEDDFDSEDDSKKDKE